MLRNRVYIGEIKWGERYFTGQTSPAGRQKHFAACQDLLDGKIRRTTTQINMPPRGGLFTCQDQGALITDERIKRKLKGGGVRPHDSYRCPNNYPDESHPSMRWRGDDLEDAMTTMTWPVPQFLIHVV